MTEQFEDYRPMMFSIAYRMLGSVMEAEDMIQEAYLRYQATPPETIQSHSAFLSTVVTRLCLDHLKSARVKRETYIGPWLPEPVLTADNDSLLNPAKRISEYESISMAFLVLLENLSPAERAVFLLREVFDYPYEEVAEIVGKSESACRQLFSRAKKHIANQRPRFQSTPEEHDAILTRFIAAAGTGDLEGLTALLAEDVGLWSDGGGKATAAIRPLHGAETVSRFLIGIQRNAPEGMTFDFADVNGRTAILFRDGNNKVFFVLTVGVSDGQIRWLRIVGNPDKLQHLI